MARPAAFAAVFPSRLRAGVVSRFTNPGEARGWRPVDGAESSEDRMDRAPRAGVPAAVTIFGARAAPRRFGRRAPVHFVARTHVERTCPERRHPGSVAWTPPVGIELEAELFLERNPMLEKRYSSFPVAHLAVGWRTSSGLAEDATEKAPPRL